MKSVKSNGKDQSTSKAITSLAADAVNVTDAVKDHSSSLQPPPCGPSHYKEGETVIALHESNFYPAKIKKIEFNEDWRYFIHYIGWKERWDEWVGVDRLVKFTDENSQILSRDTKRVAHKLDKIPATQKKQTNDSFVVYENRKRKRENFEVKEKDNVVLGKQINMSIPLTLKKQLIADFQFINKMEKLVKLPRVPNIDDILDKYHNNRGKKEDLVSTSVKEVVNGVRFYFNKALPVMLLYNKERQQYEEVIANNKVSPSRVYGAEHLLRLFVKLPNLLNNLSIDDETRRELYQNLHDILRFLQKNQSLFFLSTY